MLKQLSSRSGARSLCAVAVFLMGGLLSSVVSADDLAALAKKEKARRAKVANPGKVLTESDGKEAATKGSGSVTALPGESSSPAQAESEPAGDSRGAQRAAWKIRADGARQAVVTAQKNLEQMERDLAAFRSDVAPVSAAEAQDPMRFQKREARIVEINSAIQGQKTAITEAKKTLSALEDEARRKGVPAGWLR